MNIGTAREVLLLDEISRLRGICRAIYEMWAGSESTPLGEPLPKAYLLSLIESMRDEARKGLR